MTATKISDAEEARVQQMIASDPDAPEATDQQLANARPFAEAFPDLAAKMRKNVGGRPRSDNPKQPISIRLDQDVIAKFKATGPGWQSRINEALRRAKLSQ
ncbi:MAG: BrnA antitoxin family protein [Pseudomonadota bacterium]|nr:BrnA antitoxin family protein [Pseudomonadota bacterium]